jgi:hypothetical protein
MKIVKVASGKNKIKISKKEWLELGKKAGWMKIAQNNRVRWFDWEDLNSGEMWTIQYRDLDANELDESYDIGKGIGPSEKDVMLRMLLGIENKNSGKKLNWSEIEKFIDPIIGILSPSEFFEMVQETNKEFMDEERIEQRDMDMGLLDR